MSKKTDSLDKTRTGKWRPESPYNTLPKLPPKGDLETRAVLKQCVQSRAALAELKQAAALIPNPSVLITTLPALEAQASSEIENVVTTADNLFKHMGAIGEADPATREANHYRAALLEGFEWLKSRAVNTNLAESICTRIKGTQMAVRKVPGTTLAQTATGRVIYTPPVGEALIRDLLANWERFLHEEEPLDPLVRMAVGHYQFEAIHPFTDGNGRTGRVLNSLYLVEQGLLTLPVLYLSRYIIRNRAKHYRLLLGVTREGAWEPWILYMLRGVQETSNWTTAKIEAIRLLLGATIDHVSRKVPKIYTHELVEAIFKQPYCRIGNLVEARIAKRQTASVHLKALASIGVLREETHGREKLFVHSKLMSLLTTDENSFAPYAKADAQAASSST